MGVKEDDENILERNLTEDVLKLVAELIRFNSNNKKMAYFGQSYTDCYGTVRWKGQ